MIQLTRNSCLDRWSPLPSYVAVPHVVGYPALADPRMFKTRIQTPGYNCSSSKPPSSYLSFSPPEVMCQFLRFSLLNLCSESSADVFQECSHDCVLNLFRCYLWTKLVTQNWNVTFAKSWN